MSSIRDQTGGGDQMRGSSRINALIGHTPQHRTQWNMQRERADNHNDCMDDCCWGAFMNIWGLLMVSVWFY